MTESLSIQQARKLVLLSQRLPPTKKNGGALAATLQEMLMAGEVLPVSIDKKTTMSYQLRLSY